MPFINTNYQVKLIIKRIAMIKFTVLFIYIVDR